MEAPSGVVTFMFTDLVDSTRLWSTQPDAMSVDLERHDQIVRERVEQRGGYVFSTAGDGFAVAFADPAAAVAAAIALQREMATGGWTTSDGLEVRVGVHTGTAIERGGDYFGPDVNTAARIMGAASGGQILVSSIAGSLDASVRTRALGDHRLRGLPGPVELYQVLAEGIASEFPPVQGIGEVPSTLPEARTSFLGRADDVIRLRRLTETHRLVTVTGPGGAGKTRLAIEAASALTRYRGGVYFVDLAAIDDPAEIPWAVGAGIGLRVADVEARRPRIDAFLEGREVLLVVDNCEHVIDDAAEFIDELLESAPGLSALATSREPLGIEGENILRVPSLDAATSGLRLFIERATALDPTFDVDQDVRDAIVELCGRLDGLPLAIELAASRTTTFTPTELLSRIDDQLTLLSGGRRRRSTARQRTLEGAISWSHDLLTDEERRFFRRLSGFAGTFVLEVVAGVTGSAPADAERLLDALVSKSLVDRVVIDADRTGFRMLESVRAYASAKLTEAGEVADVVEAHLRAYHDHCEFGVHTMCGDWSWIRAYKAQIADIWIALDRALEQGQPDVAVDLIDAGSIGAIGDGPRFAETLLRLEQLANEHYDALDDNRRGRLLGDLVMAQLSAGQIFESISRAAHARADLSHVPVEYRVGLEVNLAIAGAVSDPRATVASIDRATQSAGMSAHAQQAVDQLSYMKAACLAMERRYDEAVNVGTETLTPADTFIRDTNLAVVLWAAHLGNIEPPPQAVAWATAVDPGDGGWRFSTRLAAALHARKRDDARQAVVELARRWCTGRLPYEEAEYLVTLARLAHLEGDDDRAMEMLGATAPRSPWLIIAMVETLGTIEGWPAEDWERRRATLVARRNEPAAVTLLAARGPEVLRTELERYAS